MALSYASTVIDATADAVWARIRDFNAMPDWNREGIATSEIEDGKTGDQVGAVRSFTLVADGAHLREKLLAHSDEKRFYTYDFQKTPFDVDNYNATLRVTPVTDGDKAFVEWWVTFDCDRDQQEHWIGFFGNVVFQNGLESIKKRMRGE
jgi:Polyketide cyclase / dehydrase and lipid transport